MNYFNAFAISRIFLPQQIWNKYKIITTVGFFIVAYLSLCFRFLSDYFITDFTIWATLLLSVYVIKPDANKKSNASFLILSFVFLTLTFLSGVQTFFFLAIGMAVLFAIESIAGNIGILPLFLVGLLSPTFKYFNNLLGFPMRLQLSEWAGAILKHMGYKIEVLGNVIVLNGSEFSVDPACVGLKMMVVSILSGLLIMAYFERIVNKRISFSLASLILFIIVGLNILSNLIRIIILTMFEILPSNPNHDVVGVLCLIVYVIVPSYFLIKFSFEKMICPNTKLVKRNFCFRKVLFFNFTLLLAITLIGFSKLNTIHTGKNSLPNISLSEYSKTIVKGDILKFEKHGVLVYIKPMERFYGAEHNPMICWIGSGYKFSRINKQTINNKEIYTGILKKGNDKLYSAWWFDNGSHQTISQTEWRWRALKGEKFYLVNVSAENETKFKQEVAELLKQQITFFKDK